ncbi:helix-turn-helix domain-containing protein [Polaribacter batillariae]|uniref:Helix-turn-helix domain-containing protein n=1 Tax=Polaribacter batillariae TaxID=2808900 RepID=A0ABX7SYJ1_9FLAO|nr:helix-turn-helix domain-containing protein [Polaribacter batillariae]QTD37618.1 helix-turn-helix domain-containing protein [Polaribacter batillariae]QTD37929.1 helix-turn-helix domain-containing protein [Polaribacter batillariae]QTD38071.1 helix-turn-helix domain-containing protein [Polaribacter batillariae]
MPKQINITVKESEEELSSLLRKAKSERERGRLKVLILVKQGKVVYQSQLAYKLGFTEKTIREWLKTYNSYGLSELITIKVGGNNTRVISERVIDFIATQLTNPQTTVTSYVELQGLIEATFSETIDYGTLYAHCRRKHKSRLKVSRKSHYKKDPRAEAVFKKP